MQNQINYIVKTVDEIKSGNTKEHAEIITHQKATNGNVKVNTEFRLKNAEFIKALRVTSEDVLMFKGGLSTIKWVLGFLGVGNVATFIYIVVTH